MKMSKSRSYVFTLNNYTKEDEVYLQEILQYQYIVYGREVAETGTPHLQGYVYFSNPRSFKSVAKLRKWHIEVAKGDALQNKEYTTKGDNVFEKGTRPLTPQEKGDCNKNRWKRARQLAMEGNYADIDDELYIRYNSTLKRLRAEDTSIQPLQEPPLCIYIHGPTGTGKSRICMDVAPDAYLKDPSNKWFSGYAHQPVVWIDELEPLDHTLQSLYKRLCDRYPCTVETKGGQATIRPKIILITSNYTPQLVFGPAWEPMQRRLKIFEFTHENANCSPNGQEIRSLCAHRRTLEGPSDGPQDGDPISSDASS